MSEFFQTLAGRRFTESTLPDLVQAVESCASELRRLNNSNQALNMLVRLTEKVSRANAIQHSGGTIPPEDWAELYQLQNESKSIAANRPCSH